jgi:hypothetical protein
MVTITGKGFPDSSVAGYDDTVEVALPGGGSCQVLSSSYSTITCIAGPQPAGAAAPLPIKDLYPGMRGTAVERYPNRCARAWPPAGPWRAPPPSANAELLHCPACSDSCTSCTRCRPCRLRAIAGAYPVLLPPRNYTANSYGTLWQSNAWKPADSYPGGNASASASVSTSEADLWFDLTDGLWVRPRNRAACLQTTWH